MLFRQFKDITLNITEIEAKQKDHYHVFEQMHEKHRDKFKENERQIKALNEV